MNENWRSYFCNVNDHLASIFVNLGIRSEIPIASKPWLLWVWVYFKNSRPDGLSESTDPKLLFEIEDDLSQRLSDACGAILVGRITTQGRREFYFYGERSQGYEKAVSAAMARSAGYRFDIGNKEDSLWEQYLDVLHPSDRDTERIKNRDVLNVLKEKGDVLTATRQVQHWMYFTSSASRELFKQEVAKAGYQVEYESLVEGEKPFGISVSRTQPITEVDIDATVLDLLSLAQQFGGEYDGWETPIITQ